MSHAENARVMSYILACWNAQKLTDETMVAALALIHSKLFRINKLQLRKNVKFFPSHKAHRAALIFVSLALSQTPVYTARPRIRGVPVYVPAFTGTHYAYPRRDGQAELTWVVGHIPSWFTRLQTDGHPSKY